MKSKSDAIKNLFERLEALCLPDGVKNWMYPQEIADFMGVNVSSVTSQIKRLIKIGLVDADDMMMLTVDTGRRQMELMHYHHSVLTMLLLRQNKPIEVKGFHPLVANVLHSRFSNVQHHIKLEGVGIIDFVCSNGFETVTIAECKIDSFKESHVKQVMRYCEAWGDATPLLVYCDDVEGSVNIDELSRRGINVMFVSMSKEDRAKATEYNHESKMKMLEYWVEEGKLARLYQAILAGFFDSLDGQVTRKHRNDIGEWEDDE